MKYVISGILFLWWLAMLIISFLRWKELNRIDKKLKERKGQND